MPITVSKECSKADELLLVAHSLLECAFWAAEDDEGLRVPASEKQTIRGRARQDRGRSEID